jgi:hypothetical protein
MDNQLLVPRSVSALLAEEWSINPLSMLPSFLEMKFIEDVSKSGQMALRSVLDLLMQRLSRDGEEVDESNRVSTLRTSSQQDNDNIASDSSVPAEINSRRQGDVSSAIASILRRYSSELRCLALYLIQRRCLRALSSTVAESVYGAKRDVLAQPSPRSSDDSKYKQNEKKLVPLNEKHATRLALALSLTPYLGEKLEQWQQSSASRRYRRLALLLRLTKVSLEGANFLCQWRFLLGKSIFFDLTSLCLGQVVRRVTQQDNQSASSSVPAVALQPQNAVDAPSSKTGQLVLLSLLSASVTASWLTQLRAMWQDYRQRRTAREPTGHLPPPHVSFSSTTDRHLCPLCRRPWVEPTAAPSGIVFCRPCLISYVKDNGWICPVTGVDCPESRTVRLYEPQQQRERTP